MSDGGDVTVVWLAEDEVRPAADAGGQASPSTDREDAARALADWARTKNVRIRPPSNEAARVIAVNPRLADSVEADLDRARDAIAAIDPNAAERALARAQATLRDHPELPQAAWLSAEMHRMLAVRFTRLEPRDEARARTEWQTAAALDGGRVPGIGEPAFAAEPKTGARLVIRGSRRGSIVRIDGHDVGPGTRSVGDSGKATGFWIDAAPGEHQLVVADGAETVHASWVVITPPTPNPNDEIAIALDEAPVCSAASFGDVTREGQNVRAPSVGCAEWVAAIPSKRPKAVLIARCVRSECAPLVEWRSDDGATKALPPVTTTTAKGWPAWATWTLVGVGAAAATTLGLVAAGAFASPPTETRFVAGGVRTE